MSKIYVASSWRNDIQPAVVIELRGHGHEVYDFRHPQPGDKGFHWAAIDPDWQNWTPYRYRESLNNPIAGDGFRSDFEAMEWADTCVLVLPCGRSAHLEAGWFVGSQRRLIILLDSNPEPELMYKMADEICLSMRKVVEALEGNHAET